MGKLSASQAAMLSAAEEQCVRKSQCYYSELYDATSGYYGPRLKYPEETPTPDYGSSLPPAFWADMRALLNQGLILSRPREFGYEITAAGRQAVRSCCPAGPLGHAGACP